MADNNQTENPNVQDSQLPGETTPPADKIPTQAEIDAKIAVAVEEAKKEAAAAEKKKLYDSLKKKDDELSSLRSKAEELEKLEAARAQKAEEERKAKLSDEEKKAEAIANANLKVEQLTTAFSKLKEETQASLKAKELELLRKDLIAEAGGKIIPDLVKGSTEDELRESVEKAKARYQQIVDEVAKDIKPTTTPDDEIPTRTTEVPHQKKTTIPRDTSEPNADEVLQMTPEKFREYKENTLKKFGV